MCIRPKVLPDVHCYIYIANRLSHAAFLHQLFGQIPVVIRAHVITSDCIIFLVANINNSIHMPSLAIVAIGMNHGDSNAGELHKHLLYTPIRALKDKDERKVLQKNVSPTNL